METLSEPRDIPIPMSEWFQKLREDTEKAYALKAKHEDMETVEIIHQVKSCSPKSHSPPAQLEMAKSPPKKSERPRRHSGYEPDLDEIKEEEVATTNIDDQLNAIDLAAIHRERAKDAGHFKRENGRMWRYKQYKTFSGGRPRSNTC